MTWGDGMDYAPEMQDPGDGDMFGAFEDAVYAAARCEFCGRFMEQDGKGHEACLREYDRSTNPNG